MFGHDERFSNDFEPSLSGCHGMSFSTIAQSSEGDCSTSPEYMDARVHLVGRDRRLTHSYENLSGNGSLGVVGLRQIKASICQLYEFLSCSLVHYEILGRLILWIGSSPPSLWFERQFKKFGP